jgi:replicative DNA helicase
LLLARSSVGKTGLALSLAKNIMLNGSGNGTMRHVLFWSGEQQVYMLTAKLICQLTGCTQQEVLGMTIPDQTSSGKIQMMREALAANRHLHLMDGRQTIDQIWGYAARLRDWHGLAAIFLDQFDKLSHTAGHKGQSKEQVWGESSARLFEMQKDLGCPLFVLAQLGIKNQKDHPRPVAWHVRDCSQLIQDCDRAYVIDRPEAEPERWEQMLAKQPVEARKLEGHARITLEKNRNGIGGLWSEIIPFSRTCGRFGQHAAGDLDRNKSQSTGYYEQTESTEGKW